MKTALMTADPVNAGQESANDEAARRGWIIEAPCVRASALLRPPPVTSTSAAPARRSSTGCTRAGTAARSSSASRTPTSSARRPTWSPASSTACAGWASTGTKGPDVGGPHAPYFQSERLDRYRAAAAQPRRRAATPTTATARRSGCARSASRPKQRGEAWQYDRACLALPPEQIAELEARARRARSASRCPAGAHAFDDAVHGRIEFDGAQHRGLRRSCARTSIRPITSRSSSTTWTWGSRT